MSAGAETTARAVSSETMNCHDIEWRKIHGTARRLQARIVKATQADRWGKVKALQRLLPRSFRGKEIATKAPDGSKRSTYAREQ